MDGWRGNNVGEGRVVGDGGKGETGKGRKGLGNEQWPMMVIRYRIRRRPSTTLIQPSDSLVLMCVPDV